MQKLFELLRSIHHLVPIEAGAQSHAPEEHESILQPMGAWIESTAFHQKVTQDGSNAIKCPILKVVISLVVRQLIIAHLLIYFF